MTHTCKNCGEQDIKKFSKHSRSNSGYQNLCKTCFSQVYSYKRKYEGVNCKVEGCASDAISKGYCRKHYKQIYDHGMTYKGRSRKWKPKPKPVIIPTDGIVWPISTINKDEFHDEYR